MTRGPWESRQAVGLNEAQMWMFRWKLRVMSVG